MSQHDRRGFRWLRKQTRHLGAILATGLLSIGAGAQEAASRDPAPVGDQSITAEVVDVDGAPVQRSSIGFFRALADGEAAERGDVKDPATEKSWRNVKGAATGGKMSAEGLAPGTYRVVARRGHHDQTPVGMSDPVVLDGSRKSTTVTVRLVDGPSILVRAVDATSGAALSGVAVHLQNNAWPTIASTERPSDRQDFVVFDHLTAGQYTVTASNAPRHPSDLQYRLDAPHVIDLGEKHQEVVLRLRGASLSEEEVARRWPWVAIGRVTDARGAGIAGATVRAATGMGTLTEGGSATTDADGRYWLRFAEGIGMTDGVALQAALFFASKPLMAEKNLNRQGNMMMARRKPPDVGAGAGRTVILPGGPVGIDFVLVPAASLQVELLGADGEPLVVRSLCIDGEVLPPGSSVLASAEPQFNSEFRFAEVPIGQSWWLSAQISRKEKLRSPPFTVREAGEYRLRLRISPEDSTGRRSLAFEAVDPSTIMVTR